MYLNGYIRDKCERRIQYNVQIPSVTTQWQILIFKISDSLHKLSSLALGYQFCHIYSVLQNTGGVNNIFSLSDAKKTGSQWYINSVKTIFCKVFYRVTKCLPVKSAMCVFIIESAKTTSIWIESTKVLFKKIKHNLRHGNKLNKNKVLSYCEALRYICCICKT